MGLCVLATWLFMAVVFRYSSLSALVAAGAAPIYAIFLVLPREWIWATAIMSLLLIWRHKSNIQNLMSGKESKIGSKKKESQSG
jgi:glycerol-3-phosphate acyltransferase PlsY